MIATKPFGATGHDSSRVIFGAAALWATPQREADAALQLLLEHGINHIDTAASYGDAELRLAPWMREHRDRFFLATKTEERSYAAAREQIRRSLERLEVDQVDLIQLHCLVHPAEWDEAMGEDGALRAAVEARDEGLVRFIGVTGHGLTIAAMHLRSLERFAFDSVLLPYSHVAMQDEPYASDFGRVLATCNERNVAVQTIKGIARGPWGSKEHTSLDLVRAARRSGARSTSPCTGCSASPRCSSTAPATSSCCPACSMPRSASAHARTRRRWRGSSSEQRLSTLFV